MDWLSITTQPSATSHVCNNPLSGPKQILPAKSQIPLAYSDRQAPTTFSRLHFRHRPSLDNHSRATQGISVVFLLGIPFRPLPTPTTFTTDLAAFPETHTQGRLSAQVRLESPFFHHPSPNFHHLLNWWVAQSGRRLISLGPPCLESPTRRKNHPAAQFAPPSELQSAPTLQPFPSITPYPTKR